MEDLRPAFGHRIRALREKLHLSQEQVAERADLHWTYISGIERGRRNPGLNTMGGLAEALGVSLSALVLDLKGAAVTKAGKAPSRGKRKRRPQG